MGDGVTALMWFAVVLAAIPLTLWVLKRTPLAGGGRGGLRSIAVLPLSGSQRIVTVEVGEGEARRWLVLGVTTGSIATLHTMAPQAEPPAPLQPPQVSFAHMLSRLKREARSGDVR